MSERKCVVKTKPNAGQRAVKPRVAKVGLKRSVHEFRHWSFDETNELMAIWSVVDLDLFDTKIKCYKHIQRHLKSRGFERTSEQIRCKLSRMTSFEGYHRLR